MQVKSFRDAGLAIFDGLAAELKSANEENMGEGLFGLVQNLVKQ